MSEMRWTRKGFQTIGAVLGLLLAGVSLAAWPARMPASSAPTPTPTAVADAPAPASWEAAPEAAPEGVRPVALPPRLALARAASRAAAPRLAHLAGLASARPTSGIWCRAWHGMADAIRPDRALRRPSRRPPHRPAAGIPGRRLRAMADRPPRPRGRIRRPRPRHRAGGRSPCAATTARTGPTSARTRGVPPGGNKTMPDNIAGSSRSVSGWSVSWSGGAADSSGSVVGNEPKGAAR